MPLSKAEARRQLRAAFPGDAQRAEESRLLCAHMACWPVFCGAETVGAYVPLRREADVTELMRLTLARGGTLALPRVEGDGVMTFRRVSSLGELKPGAFGIPEPPEELPVIPPEQLSLLIVPLEGVDRAGMRLGKGGGFYDRLMASVSCPRVGAAMSWQWMERVPQEPWDLALDACADRDGIHFFTRSGKDGND